MKQIFKNVLGIAAITLFLGIVYASLNALQAEDKKDLPLYNKDQLNIRQVPLYCGYTGFIFQTAFEIFGEEPIAGAEVRAKGNPESPVIGLLTFTYNRNNNKGTHVLRVFRRQTLMTDISLVPSGLRSGGWLLLFKTEVFINQSYYL